MALFSKFRGPDEQLATEWATFKTVNAAQLSHLSNNLLQHHYAVTTFCRARKAGCSWAQYHALVDASIEPFAHLFDQNRISAEVPRSASSCSRLHKPTADDLLELVKRSEPAVLTGLLDGWPALERWTHDYLNRHLGSQQVTVSISEGFFDVPEDPAIWGVADRPDGLEGVVARPAHETMSLSEALRIITAPGPPAHNLSYYLEYFPMEALRQPLLHADLRPACAARDGAGRGAAAEEVCAADRSQDYAPPDGLGGGGAELSDGASVLRPGDPDVVPRLARGGEPGELEVASWLHPRKHLLWMGSGGTVGSTHYDPYENLMLVIAGAKTFHLANPDEGKRVGGFTKMAEAHFELARRSPAPPDAPPAPPALLRPTASVTDATELHHYAAAALSRPASEQPHVPALRDATVFSCTARAGEVLYVPAYWWHEVHSERGEGGRPSIGVNWFYEAYYQRIFPNMSWDRSLHYLMLGAAAGNPLRQPFPPHDTATPPPGPPPPGPPPPGPPSAAARRPTSFAARLAEKGKRG